MNVSLDQKEGKAACASEHREAVSAQLMARLQPWDDPSLDPGRRPGQGRVGAAELAGPREMGTGPPAMRFLY